MEMVLFGPGGPININLIHEDGADIELLDVHKGYGKPNRWLIRYLRNGYEFYLPIYNTGKHQPAISTICNGVESILGRVATPEEQAQIAKIHIIVP